MAYLLDANVFIDAKNRYYGFDFCPGFWDWVDLAHADGRVMSIEIVGDDLVGGGGDLAPAGAPTTLDRATTRRYSPSVRHVDRRRERTMPGLAVGEGTASGCVPPIRRSLGVCRPY